MVLSSSFFFSYLMMTQVRFGVLVGIFLGTVMSSIICSCEKKYSDCEIRIMIDGRQTVFLRRVNCTLLATALNHQILPVTQ